MTPSTTRITIEKDYLHFSCAHFTIFSATERENLHGHNYHVRCELDAQIGKDGLCFDYNEIKTALLNLCKMLDEYTLLPENSPYLEIIPDSNAGNGVPGTELVIAKFGAEQIPFLSRDIKCLPIRNVTIEELSSWLLRELDKDVSLLNLPVQQVCLGVSSGAGQWALSHWNPPSAHTE
ncbi:MAG: 6-carboxytetrahydropterin synthase [Pseudomonadales bacterium]|nr:6-carboxytetrahydropterin synthase [Pseudomonadales bacterium]